MFFSKKISSNNKVLAVEPTPRALRYLYKNIERNNCSKTVIVFEGVNIDTNSKVTINTIAGKEEYSSLAPITHSSVADLQSESLIVEGRTLDSLVDEFNLNPGFIKIDAEGAEFLVLRGASSILKYHQPVILFELSNTLLLNFGETSSQLIKFLRDHGYSVFNAEAPNVKIKNRFEGEILAIPNAITNPIKI